MSKKALFFVLIAAFIMAPLAFGASYEEMKTAYYRQFDGVQQSMAEKQLAEDYYIQYIAPYQTTNELDELGGPDGFGYSFIDSQEEGGPEYTWVDIYDTAEEVTGWSDDNTQGSYLIGFDFPFYGETYSEFYACSNGWISFSADQGASYSNTLIPTASVPNNAIFWFWDDFVPNASDTMYYEEVEEGHLVIQFGNENRTFANNAYAQVHLYENGEIIVSYDEACTRTITSETIGLENIDGTVGLQASYNTTPADYPVYGTSILFYLPEADASLSGTVTDSETGAALEGVVVRAAGGTATTDESGNYSIEECYSGSTNITAVIEGEYLNYSETIVLEEGENTYNFAMVPYPAWVYRSWREEDYTWIDVSENATDLELGDDSSTELVFADYGLEDFEWYGVDYSSIYVISNGWLSFINSSAGGYSNPAVCPDPAEPNGTIAFLAMDLNPADHGTVWAENVDGQLVITFEEVPYYYHYDNYNTLQIVMDFEELDLWLNYDSMYVNDDPDMVSIGYEDHEGIFGSQIYRAMSDTMPDLNNVSFHIYIPSDYAQVSGTITDTEGNPLLDAGVALAPEDGDILTAFTDEFGHYEFIDVTPGTYDLAAVLDGYSPYVQEDIVLEADDNAVIDITLAAIGTYSIEDIQTTVETGTWVTTTGIVTLPTNSINTDRFSCYIQDATGYGVMLYDYDAIDPENNLNRGDEIQVTGQITEYYGVTEIVDFEYEVLTTGNDLPIPYTGTTGDMAELQAFEGSWAEIMGQLQGDPETGSYTLSVDDGSGAVNVRINEDAGLDLSEFAQSDWVVFRGPIGLYQNAVQIIPSLAEDFNAPVLDAPTDVTASREDGSPLVKVEWVFGDDETDEFIEFIIFRNGNALTEVDTIGFEDNLDGEDAGTFTYWIVASYDEGMSANSDTASVDWDGVNVSENLFAQIPTEYSIARAYPNPFNPTMTAVIGLPDASNLDVRVFNILGEQVSVLAQGRFTQGYHSFTFDATNLSSGLYFIQAHVPGKMNAVRKVTLVR